MKEKELLRLTEMKKIEEEFYEKKIELIGGIDEAGRGPLAGPVVVACVIMPKDSMIEGVNDSKKRKSFSYDNNNYLNRNYYLFICNH